jgi:hypothetical protein
MTTSTPTRRCAVSLGTALRTGAVAGVIAAVTNEHGYQLDRGFGQAVKRSLAGSRVLASEQSRLDESLESVSEVPTSGCKPQAEGAGRAEAGRGGCADPHERVHA